MSEIIEMNPAMEGNLKPYVFRPLSAVDVFPMFKIIGAIGINEFTACFEKDGVKNLIASVNGESGENLPSIIGISVVLEIANVIMGNIPRCENEIYQILSQTSNLSVAQIKKLDMAVFFEMVIDFIKKEEFKDFIKVVSKLFK
jgi:hypothetical protein